MTYPLPDQPLPEGWSYIEHPEVGRADNPVPRDALNTWKRAGWTEVSREDLEAEGLSVAVSTEEANATTAAPSDAADTTASPRRSRAAAADQSKE